MKHKLASASGSPDSLLASSASALLQLTTPALPQADELCRETSRLRTASVEAAARWGTCRAPVIFFRPLLLVSCYRLSGVVDMPSPLRLLGDEGRGNWLRSCMLRTGPASLPDKTCERLQMPA